jgi:uncharacterized membrane protein YkoI
MIGDKFLPAILAALLVAAGLFGPGRAALAALQNPAETVLPLVNESRPAIAAFEHANVPLAHAIDKAEQYGGGRPVAVAFGFDRGRPVYVADVYHDGIMWEGRLDATTNLQVGPATTRRVRLAAAEMAMLRNPWMTLPQAVGRTEQLYHGKAIDARLITLAGNLVYAIGIVRDGKIEPAIINPMSPHANTSPVRSGVPLNQR